MTDPITVLHRLFSGVVGETSIASYLTAPEILDVVDAEELESLIAQLGTVVAEIPGPNKDKELAPNVYEIQLTLDLGVIAELVALDPEAYELHTLACDIMSDLAAKVRKIFQPYLQDDSLAELYNIDIYSTKIIVTDVAYSCTQGNKYKLIIRVELEDIDYRPEESLEYFRAKFHSLCEVDEFFSFEQLLAWARQLGLPNADRLDKRTICEYIRTHYNF